jgi:hypothetical protein
MRVRDAGQAWYIGSRDAGQAWYIGIQVLIPLQKIKISDCLQK